MSENSQPTSGEVVRSIRSFRDYAHDVLRADSGTFADRMGYLGHFCESDVVFSTIHSQLMNHPEVDFKSWIARYGGLQGYRMGAPRFPDDPDQRVSLMYQLWFFGAKNPSRLLNNVKFWFRTGGPSISGYIRKFSDAVLDPMFREILYRLKDIETKLPKEGTANVSRNSLQIIHIKTESIIMTKHEFTNSKNIQIGNQNVQDNREVNLDVTLQEIIDQIDRANTSDAAKQEAKNRFQKLLEHPLVSAIVSGATSALLTQK